MSENFTPPADPKADAVWVRWVSKAGRTLNHLTSNGTTTNRPTTGLYVGRFYFDTTLGYPIWYDGSGWVNGAGASV